MSKINHLIKYMGIMFNRELQIILNVIISNYTYDPFARTIKKSPILNFKLKGTQSKQSFLTISMQFRLPMHQSSSDLISLLSVQYATSYAGSFNHS